MKNLSRVYFCCPLFPGCKWTWHFSNTCVSHSPIVEVAKRVPWFMEVKWYHLWSMVGVFFVDGLVKLDNTQHENKGGIRVYRVSG